MLYWGEGDKGKNSCALSNSDLNLLIFFLRFLRECYDVVTENIRVRINCHTTNNLSVEDIENYWIQTLSLPKSCFGKTTTDSLSKYSQQKKSKNKLLYGTATISVHNTEIVQNIYGAIQEYAGFANNFYIG